MQRGCDMEDASSTGIRVAVRGALMALVAAMVVAAAIGPAPAQTVPQMDCVWTGTCPRPGQEGRPSKPDAPSRTKPAPAKPGGTDTTGRTPPPATDTTGRQPPPGTGTAGGRPPGTDVTGGAPP